MAAVLTTVCMRGGQSFHLLLHIHTHTQTEIYTYALLSLSVPVGHLGCVVLSDTDARH